MARRTAWSAIDVILGSLLSGIVLIVLLATDPLLNVARNDDVAYAHSARELAERGRVAYNGWGSPILLPQMLCGALVIKIWGFSYAALSLIGLISAALVAAVMYALARSSGCTPASASIATACLALNPIFLSNAPSFMSDIPSLLLLLIALLVLIRSLDVGIDGRVQLRASGLLLSVVLAFIAGANRQVNWVGYLGALAALTLLVPRQRWLTVGAAALLVAGAVPLVIWFDQQPYTIPMNLMGGLRSAIGNPIGLTLFVYRMLNMLGLLVFPVAIAVMRPECCRNRLFRSTAVALLLPTLLPTGAPFSVWEAVYSLPGCGQYFTSSGALVGGVDFTADGIASDVRPGVLPGIVVRVLVVAGVLGLACTVYSIIRRMQWLSRSGARSIAVKRVAVLALVATSPAQLIAMVPWLAHGIYFDRYLLSLLPGPLILMASLWKVKKHWAPICASVLLVMALGGIGVIFAHDYVKYIRAGATLYETLVREGIPRSKIDGGFEFNAETQLQIEGSINHPLLRNPPFRSDASGHFVRAIPDCFPSLDVRYCLTSESTPDPKKVFPEPIAKVTYFAILPPRRREMYAYAIRRTSDR